jgi:hypothetical protein
MRLISFKKYIAILLSIWLVIVIAGLIFSRSMQDKIIGILSDQVSKHLTTEIHIRKSDIHFSVIKKFPLASIELRNVCFKIPPSVDLNESNPIKGDTLLFAKSLFLQLNLKSLINKKHELQRISLKNGYLQILSDKNGNSSLEIIRKKEKADTTNFAARIEELSVNNLTIYTSHKANKSQSQTFIKQGTASGTFTKNDFSVKLKTNGKVVNFQAKNQKIEPNQSFSIDTEIEHSKDRFTINRGYFNISNIPFTVVGTITPGDNTLVNLIFSANSIPIKQIDKAVLRGLIGETGFVPRSGTIDIQSTFIGYTRYNLPSIKANFTIKKGKFYDTQRKLNYDNIYIVGNADNGKTHLPKSTTIRIDTFRFQCGDSWQTGRLKIQNLIEPYLSASLHGYVNINDMEGVIEIPDVQLVEGNFTNNIALVGTIKKDDNKNNNLLDALQIWGDVSIMKLGLVLEKHKIPYTLIKGDVKLNKDLSLQFDSLYAKSGHSDIVINGRLSHVLRKTGVPKFVGNVYSNFFLADDFITPSSSANKKKAYVNFPDSAIILGSVHIKEFTFAKFSTNEIKGNITYRNKILTLEPFNMKGFKGTLNGKLKFQQIKNENIVMNADAKLSQVNIKELFEACNNFSQNVISSEHLNGTISGNIAFSSSWTNKLKFIPADLLSQNNITIRNGELIDYQPLLGLSKYIEVEELRHIKFNKLETSILIRDEKVLLEQTTIASSAITFDGSGMHGFDNKYEYRFQLGLSDVLWGKAKNKKKEVSEFGYVVDDGVGHTTVPIILFGKGTNFNVKWDKKTARNTFKQKLQAEKQKLNNLFKNQENKVDTTTSIQPKNPIDQQKTLQKTDSGNYKVKTDEHTIIWDDSADDDEEDDGLN